MNCWYTMATLRFCTDTDVTSAPFSSRRPLSGRSRPAIMRSSVVLPDNVGPSRMLKPPASTFRLTSTRKSTPSRLRLTFSSSTVTATSPGRARRRDRAARRASGQPAIQGVDVDARGLETELGAAPQDVLAGARPFALDQPAHLGLVQSRAEVMTEVGKGVGAVDESMNVEPVAPEQGLHERSRQERKGPSTFLEPRLAFGRIEVSARQGGSRRPRLRHRAGEGRDALQHRLRQAPVRGELAADHVDDAGPVSRLRVLEHVVPGRLLGLANAVVVQRANTGETSDDVRGTHPMLEIVGHARQQVVALFVARGDDGRVAVVVDVGGADEDVVVLEGQHEHDAPVMVLQDVGAVVVEPLAHDQVTALDLAGAGSAVIDQF